MARAPLFPALAILCGVALVDIAAHMRAPAGVLLASLTADDEIVTGSSEPKKPASPEAKSTAPVERAEPFVSSGSESDILNRLQQRRDALEQREKQLDLRESLLKAADQKLESRIEELKAIETRIKQNEAPGGEVQTIRQLAILYESMKPKDAARVFERLDMAVLLPVAQVIPPRKLAEILAVMSPASAEKLTVELARGPGSMPQKAAAVPSQSPLPPGELPSVPPARAP